MDVSNEVLAAANKIFDHFFMVGTTERLQETVDLLAWHCGWPHIPFNSHENTSPSRDLLGNLDGALVENLLEHDNNLYAKADNRLDNELSGVFGDNHTETRRAALINDKATALIREQRN